MYSKSSNSDTFGTINLSQYLKLDSYTFGAFFGGSLLSFHLG